MPSSSDERKGMTRVFESIRGFHPCGSCFHIGYLEITKMGYHDSDLTHEDQHDEDTIITHKIKDFAIDKILARALSKAAALVREEACHKAIAAGFLHPIFAEGAQGSPITDEVAQKLANREKTAVAYVDVKGQPECAFPETTDKVTVTTGLEMPPIIKSEEIIDGVWTPDPQRVPWAVVCNAALQLILQGVEPLFSYLGNKYKFTRSDGFPGCKWETVKMNIHTAKQLQPEHTGSKYVRLISDMVTGEPVSVDVYCVLEAFNVTNPGLQHAIKKLLCAGLRGKGDTIQDLKEAQDAISRAITIEQQRTGKED